MQSAHDRNNILNKPLLIYGILFTVLYFIFAPVVNGYFLFHDDYFSIFPPEHWLILKLGGDGRPLLGLYYHMMSYINHTMADAHHLRLLGLAGLTGFALQYRFFFLRLKKSPLEAAGIALMLCTLPPCMLGLCYSLPASANVILLLILPVYLLSEKAAIAWTAACRGKAFRLFLGAVALDILLMNFYQPDGIYMMMFVAAALLFMDRCWKTSPRTLFLTSLLVCFAASMGYLLLFKLSFKLFAFWPNPRTTINFDATKKFVWFVTEVIPNCLNFWSVHPKLVITQFNAAVIMDGFLAGLYFQIIRGGGRARRRGRWGVIALCLLALLAALLPGTVWPHGSRLTSLWVATALGVACGVYQIWLATRIHGNPWRAGIAVFPYLERCFWIACTVPLGYLANLASKEYWAAYRTLLAPSAILLLIFLGALGTLLKLLHARAGKSIYLRLLVLIALAGFAITNRTAQQEISEPQSMELRYLMSVLRQADMTRIKLVTILQPAICQFIRYDDIGVPSSYHDWSSDGLVRFSLHELHMQPRRDLKVRFLPPGALKGKSDSELVIDMRTFNNFYGPMLGF